MENLRIYLTAGFLCTALSFVVAVRDYSILLGREVTEGSEVHPATGVVVNVLSASEWEDVKRRSEMDKPSAVRLKAVPKIDPFVQLELILTCGFGLLVPPPPPFPALRTDFTQYVDTQIQQNTGDNA